MPFLFNNVMNTIYVMDIVTAPMVAVMKLAFGGTAQKQSAQLFGLILAAEAIPLLILLQVAEVVEVGIQIHAGHCLMIIHVAPEGDGILNLF